MDTSGGRYASGHFDFEKAVMVMKTIRMGMLGVAVVAAGALAAETQPANPALGAGKVVMLDEFFNHQEKNGNQFHYVWEDTAASGFSKFGAVWKENGATVEALHEAPTAADLKKTSVYILVNPSTEKNAAGGKPNYIDEKSIDAIDSWVKEGGVLLMLANDRNNCEFEHYNKLAERFGFQFDGNLRNTAPKVADRPHAIFERERDHFPDHPLFAGLDRIYMKEISTITVTDPSTALLVVDKDPKESDPKSGGVGAGKDVIMFLGKVGKGTVLAIGDPWIYNEYIDLNKPAVDNRKGAVNLVQWLLSQARGVEGK